MPLSGLEQVVIVAAGVVFTLLLGGALLYWIDREWRKLEALHRHGSGGPPTGETGETPTDPPPGDPPPAD